MLKFIARIPTALLICSIAVLGACADDAAEEEPTNKIDAGADVQAEAQPDAQTDTAQTDTAQTDTSNTDTALAACPDEVDLTTVDLPCDCYGHIATDPETQVPGCQSQVVCCPSISDLRCEDHEDAAAPDAETDAETDAEPIDNCPIEKDLSTVELPCSCYGTIVEDPAVSMPSCTLTVVCCPSLKGLKCE